MGKARYRQAVERARRNRGTRRPWYVIPGAVAILLAVISASVPIA